MHARSQATAAQGRERYDLAVVGAGVVGCAIARRFTLEGARVVVLEKAAEVLDGASKGNSAILHTGFDAPVGSIEQACVAAGYAEYLRIHERLGLPLLRAGALVLAWTEEEEAQLPALLEQARANGVREVEPLGPRALRALEPGLAPDVRAGFRVPGEFIVDPWSAPHAYLLQALVNGARLRRGCAVEGGEREGEGWRLDTRQGPVRAAVVVNAAGLYGDRLDGLLLGRSAFAIRPRKGQFVVYDKPAAALVGHILLPVPSATTKGIVLCRTAFGNLLVGPTAEEQAERDRAELVQETLQGLRARGERIVPALAGVAVTACYAGLRPATQFKDYQLTAHPAERYITVGGIRSTGLTAALGIAERVLGLYREFGPAHVPLAEPAWPRMPAISECAPRSWQQPGNGGILCHCERVTRAEVEAALTGPLAAATLAGLKRRTRVTLGRCQGFYCSAELARVTRGRLTEPMTGQGDGG